MSETKKSPGSELLPKIDLDWMCDVAAVASRLLTVLADQIQALPEAARQTAIVEEWAGATIAEICRTVEALDATLGAAKKAQHVLRQCRKIEKTR